MYLSERRRCGRGHLRPVIRSNPASRGILRPSISRRKVRSGMNSTGSAWQEK